MSAGIDIVLAALAKPDHRAMRLATAICVLVKDGGACGELQNRVILVDGETRSVRVPPAVWFDRLAVALRTRAIDRMEPQAIAERILTTPEPVRLT